MLERLLLIFASGVIVNNIPDFWRNPHTVRTETFRWVKLFFTLSIKQFNQVYEILELPIQPTDELRQIAKDFALTYKIFMDGEEHRTALAHVLSVEAPSQDLLKGIPHDAPLVTKKDALFTNTFARLEQIGYANELYNWSRHTRDFYQHPDVEELALRCSLLRWWATEKWFSTSQSPSCEYDADLWQQTLTLLQPYNRPSKQVLPPLPLPNELLEKLQCIIFYHEAQDMRLRSITDTFLTAPTSIWENFALRAGGAGTWIPSEGYLKINLREWQMIVNMLSSDEMLTLEEWVVQNRPQPSRLPTHLQQLVIPFPVPKPLGEDPL